MLRWRPLLIIIIQEVILIVKFWGDILKGNNQPNSKADTKRPKRPFAKSDLEAVPKAATKSLKKEQGEKESGETSESHHLMSLCFSQLFHYPRQYLACLPLN
jgi:hypothetical protein